MATLCDLVSRLPSAIVVISCLENFYDELKKMLTRPIKDRVENDPRPVGLQTPCDRDEVVSLVGRRLRHLFETAASPTQRGRPTRYPTSWCQAGRPAARDVLLECQPYRERCVEEGKMADYPPEVVVIDHNLFSLTTPLRRVGGHLPFLDASLAVGLAFEQDVAGPQPHQPGHQLVG